MPRYGFLIDYEFCTGCRVCEMACQREHDRPEGERGIVVKEMEPEISGGIQYFVPFPTDGCDLCGRRIARGLQPACVENCWAGVMKFGKVEELIVSYVNKPRLVLWVPH